MSYHRRSDWPAAKQDRYGGKRFRFDVRVNGKKFMRQVAFAFDHDKEAFEWLAEIIERSGKPESSYEAEPIEVWPGTRRDADSKETNHLPD